MTSLFRPVSFPGTALAIAAALAVAAPSLAQVQTEGQAACITGMNKAGAKVASTQGKVALGCVKAAGKGTEPDATACITADGDGKVAAAAAKAAAIFTKSCTALPDFGPTTAPGVSNAASEAMEDLAFDLFGPAPTSALVTSTANAAGAKCQSSLASATQKLANTMVKEFLACKAAGVTGGTITSRALLAGCIPAIDLDVKGKVAKAELKQSDTVAGTCDTLDLDALFPGACEGYTDFMACVRHRARCRTCLALAGMDNLGNTCDGFDDGNPGNASCGTPAVIGERISIPNSVEPAETPGSPGVVVTNPKLITQFGPSGPDMNRSDYLRLYLSDSPAAPDAIVILVPGFGAGVNIFRILAENLLPRLLDEKGIRAEIWAFSRRDDLLEDREGARIAADEKDPLVALDWYYGGELGLSLHSSLVAGPNRRAVFYNTSSDIPFLANFTPQVFSRDIDVVVEEALAITPNVFLGGHSAGTGFTARYASTDFNLTGMGPPEPGYAKLRGLVLLEGGGGTTAMPDPLSADSIDRIIAKADGGLFGAVRDNDFRCKDGTTPCSIANEAADCFGQVPAKCTPPTTAYSALGGFKPNLYAAGEVGAVQAMTDPDSGQSILQVDQGSMGNNAIAMVPELSPLTIVDPSTTESLFGTFLDDDEAGALIAPALATSLGEGGPLLGGLSTWRDIDGDGPISGGSRPNNGPQPTTLPATIWGKEVEVTRMDRHAAGFIAGGENSSDWYYAGSGLSTLSVAGICNGVSCTAGKVSACAVNSDCNQSISLDSSAIAATRPDIANMTQAPSIDIPVISFGGSNGLTPVGSSFLGFAQSIGTCTRPSCDGTARVVDALLPSPPFPTYGDVAGGYEVYISTGYAHVDVVTAEDSEDNEIPEKLADFIERNLVP